MPKDEEIKERKEIFNKETLKELLEEKKIADESWDKKIKDFKKGKNEETLKEL